MDDLARMEQALKAASDAGDVQAAQTLAGEMRRMLKDVNPAVDAPTDIPTEARRMAAKDTGAGAAVMVGAGRKVKRIGTGIFDILSGRSAQDSKEATADEDASYAALRKEHPIATAGGEALPYVAVPASAGVLPAATTIGALEAAEPGTAKERMASGTVGALTTGAGGLFAKGAASFISPVTRKAAGGANQGALEAAERIGMRPTLGESTGSTFVKRLEDLVSRLPGGSAVMAEHQAGNATALNRAAARSIGQEADELTPEVFAAAHRDIGKVFDDVKTLPGKTIQVGPDVATAADEILRQQAKMLPTQQDPNIIKLARDAKALATNNGRIDGETYQLTRSGLSEAAFDATGTTKRQYGRLLEALDASADASLRGQGKAELADALAVAREQYGNLLTLEKGATAEAGNVSAPKVASTLRTNQPGAFRRGKLVGSEMGDIAAVGEGLKPPRAGSPTFEREVMANPLLAGMHWLWSKPTAAALTSPVVNLYPRTLGKTAGARAVSEIANPSARAAVAAALQNSGVLPFLPVAAE